MSYEIGFASGERAAYFDKRNEFTRELPEPVTPEARGFVDGYRPRSAAWVHVTRKHDLVPQVPA